MNSSTLALARRVRALLEAPERWTQGALARLADGTATYVLNDKAVAWSLHGAIGRVWIFDRHERDAAVEVTFACAAAAGIPDASVSIPEMEAWNSAHTHADVLALLDRVIAGGER